MGVVLKRQALRGHKVHGLPELVTARAILRLRAQFGDAFPGATMTIVGVAKCPERVGLKVLPCCRCGCPHLVVWDRAETAPRRATCAGSCPSIWYPHVGRLGVWAAAEELRMVACPRPDKHALTEGQAWTIAAGMTARHNLDAHSYECRCGAWHVATHQLPQAEAEAAPAGGWVRARFHADGEDWRAVTWPPPGPCWCTGYAGDGSYSTVVAYLRRGQDVRTWWPEADEVDAQDVEQIVFTDRFPCPAWWDAEKQEIRPAPASEVTA